MTRLLPDDPKAPLVDRLLLALGITPEQATKAGDAAVVEAAEAFRTASLRYPMVVEDWNAERARREELEGRRLLLFAGPTYYASGGGNDFVGVVASVEAALEDVQKRVGPDAADWAHVLDLDTQQVVAAWQRIDHGSRLGPEGWVTTEDYEERMNRLLGLAGGALVKHPIPPAPGLDDALALADRCEECMDGKHSSCTDVEDGSCCCPPGADRHYFPEEGN